MRRRRCGQGSAGLTVNDLDGLATLAGRLAQKLVRLNIAAPKLRPAWQRQMVRHDTLSTTPSGKLPLQAHVFGHQLTVASVRFCAGYSAGRFQSQDDHANTE